MDEQKKRKLKRKIENRMSRRPGKRLILKMKNGNRLRVEYMYGHRYYISKINRSGKERVLHVMTDINKLMDTIEAERDGKTNKAPKSKNRINRGQQVIDMSKYIKKK